LYYIDGVHVKLDRELYMHYSGLRVCWYIMAGCLVSFSEAKNMLNRT
jgi:hypothetical protein